MQVRLRSRVSLLIESWKLSLVVLMTNTLSTELLMHLKACHWPEDTSAHVIAPEGAELDHWAPLCHAPCYAYV